VPGLGLFYALVSAFAWTGLDATRKALTSRLSTAAIVLVFATGQVPIFAAWAWWSGGALRDPAAYAPAGAVVLVLNLVANVLFVVAVRVSPFTVTVPFLSFSPVFTAAVARPLLGEVPTALQLLGVGLVVVGALGVNLTPMDPAEATPGPISGLRRLLGAFLQERGSALMVIVALLWSGSGVADKIATRHAAVPVHAALQNTAIAVLMLGWLGARGRLRELAAVREVLGWSASSVVFAAAALGFQLLAIQHTLVAGVETTKRGVGNVMSALVGRAVFGEPVTATRAAALALMAVGTLLVGLG